MSTFIQEVRVVGSDGKGVSGKSVKLFYRRPGKFTGGYTEEVNTGSDGLARFTLEEGWWATHVYVNGSVAKKVGSKDKGTRIKVVST